MNIQIMGSACPKCGGCDFYCADCHDDYVTELEAVAWTARAFIAMVRNLEWDDEGIYISTVVEFRAIEATLIRLDQNDE